MATGVSESSVLEEVTIFDADVHCAVSPDELARHLEEPYKGRVKAPVCFPASQGMDWDNYMGSKVDNRLVEDPEHVQSALVDDFGIDHPILNTQYGIGRLPNTDLAVNLMSAYNDVLLEKYLDPTEFYGAALITTQEPEAAAEEIHRIGDEDQICALFVYSTTPDTPLGDPSYDVMYKAAEEEGLPVIYHAGTSPSMRYQFPIQNFGLETTLSTHTLGHLWSQSLVLVSLIVQGVPEKFPELDFVFVEAGISWVPYMMWRLNKEEQIRKSEAPLLTKTPEEYIRDQFYFSTQPIGEPNDPTQMRQMIELVGTESIMYSSDYPHWDFDHPSALDKYLQNMFTEEEREQVLNGNPRAVFDVS